MRREKRKGNLPAKQNSLPCDQLYPLHAVRHIYRIDELNSINRVKEVDTRCDSHVV